MLDITNFLSALGWALLHSLWQMALLWILSQIVFWRIPKVSASGKYVLSTSFLFIGFFGFIATFFFMLFTDDSQNIIPLSFGNLPFLTNSSLPVIAIAYIFSLFISGFLFVRNYRYVQIIRKYGISKAGIEWRMFVKNMSAQLNIKRNVQILFSDFVSSPVTTGFFKPVILIPVALFNYLSVQQAEALLLHELSHIKRYDYLTNLLINIVKSILHFNPFVYALCRNIEREREKSCDTLVLQFQYPGCEYANALLAIQKQSNQQKVFALSAIGRFDLLHRVETILGIPSKKVITQRGILSILFAGAVLFSSFYFERGKKNNDISSLKAVYAANNITEQENSNGFFINDPVFPLSNQKIIIKPESKIEEQAIVLDVEDTNYISPVFYLPKGENIMPVVYTGQLNEPVALQQSQQEQIKQTIASSKKVVEEMQWKAIEKDLAEVFTQEQKSELKKQYEKQVEKMDWQLWENKLSQVYSRINWDKINAQLNLAVNNIRIDSLQHVYAMALNRLEKVQKLMADNSLETLPDTDITLELIEKKKKDAAETLRQIKENRKKKIVRL